MRITALLIAGIATLGLLPAPSHAEDLIDVYQLALQNDPQIKQAEANKLSAEEAQPQALANLLPQLNLQASRGRSTTDGTRPQFFNGAFQPINFRSTSTSTDYSLNLSESLFNWAYWKQMDQADYQVAQAEANYEAAQQDLVVRVATAYFNVLAAEDNLAANEANLEALERQLEQTKKRYEVGLIAVTDVQESQAAYDRARADKIDAERQLRVARESLREITGTYIDKLDAPTGPLPLVKPDPESPDKWVDTAMQQNPSLLAARMQVQVNNAIVDERRAGHLPTLDLQASRGKNDSTDQYTVEGNSQPSQTSTYDNTQVSLSLTVPLFSGGRTSSQVTQAIHDRTAAEEKQKQVARSTERDARDAYLGVIAEISRVEALKQALQSSETALKATQAGFEVGTRTTVDVLQARNNLLRARTDYARSRYDYLVNTLKLKQAAGILGGEDVKTVNARLHQAESEEKVPGAAEAPQDNMNQDTKKQDSTDDNGKDSATR
ncbi:MAG: TolC family outer membrane protein [Gammaproteobacteria bacterium]|jgi:outer membrane protein